MAKYKPVSLERSQEKSLLGNLANFALIEDLGNKYREYFMDQQETLLPGYGETLKQGQQATLDLLGRGQEFLTGEIPKDVQERVQRSSAYRAFSGGYAGSGMSNALSARDLGLTSLDMIGRGAQMIGQGGNSAQQWASLARGGIMNPSSMLTNPSQQAELDLQNSVLRQQSQQYAYNVAAAPDPAAKGISDTIMSLIGMYMGGGFGGGGAAKGLTQPAPNLSSGMLSYQPTSLQDSWQYNATGYG